MVQNLTGTFNGMEWLREYWTLVDVGFWIIGKDGIKDLNIKQKWDFGSQKMILLVLSINGIWDHRYMDGMLGRDGLNIRWLWRWNY